MGITICPRCGGKKEPPGPTGRRDYCKACAYEIHRTFCLKNSDVLRDRRKALYDPAEATVTNRLNYLRHVEQRRESAKARARKFRKEHPARRNAISAWQRAQQIKATPRWADKQAIAEMYQEAARRTAETGIPHEVDHTVPLRSKWVCGLHWEGNLQIITRVENQAKHNSYWPDMPEGLFPYSNGTIPAISAAPM